MLNWDHLRFLIAVADHGSVSRGAQNLGVSHATALRAINRLETELQLRLFDHSQTGYRLTPDGEDVLEHARKMEQDVGLINLKAKGRDSVPSGELNIVIPDVSLFNVMPLLGEFTSTFTQITLNVKHAIVTKPSDFVEHEVDVLFQVTNEPPEQLVGRKLLAITVAAYAKRTVEEIDSHRWITWSLGQDGKKDEMLSYQQQMLQQSDQSRIVMHAQSHGDALSAVRAGVGSSFLVTTVDKDDYQPLNLTKRTTHWGVWLLTHPDFRNAVRVSALMRFMADTVFGK